MVLRARVVFIVVFCFVFAGCNGGGVLESSAPRELPAGSPQAQATPSPVQTPQASQPRPPLKQDPELANEIRKIAEDAQGKVGVAAVMFETGQSVSVDAEEKYPSQSVYKLPIAMAALKLIDEGKTSLDQQVIVSPDDFVRPGFRSPIRNANPQGTILPVSELVRASVFESDGTANDVLLDMVGGPEKVQEYLASLGIKDFIVADSTKSISKDWETQYRNWATPAASIELLWQLHERKALREATTSLLLEHMKGTPAGPKRLRKGLPKGATLAHKTGTGGSKNRVTGATNDIGIITLPDGRHVAIAIYIMDSSAPAFKRNEVMGKITKAIIERWAPGMYGDEEADTGNESKNEKDEEEDEESGQF